MLVLSRKIGEEIVINDEIRVTIVRIQGNRVQLGFAAPPEIRIQRQELTANAALALPPIERSAVKRSIEPSLS